MGAKKWPRKLDCFLTCCDVKKGKFSAGMKNPPKLETVGPARLWTLDLEQYPSEAEEMDSTDQFYGRALGSLLLRIERGRYPAAAPRRLPLGHKL